MQFVRFPVVEAPVYAYRLGVIDTGCQIEIGCEGWRGLERAYHSLGGTEQERTGQMDIVSALNMVCTEKLGLRAHRFTSTADNQSVRNSLRAQQSNLVTSCTLHGAEKSSVHHRKLKVDRGALSDVSISR